MDLQALREAAEGATPGPWRKTTFGAVWAESRTVSPIVICETANELRGMDGDAHFIATANPAAILELVERLDAARTERNAYREALTKVRANFNVAHKRAIERGDAVGTQWLDVEFLTRDALSLPPVADERTEP